MKPIYLFILFISPFSLNAATIVKCQNINGDISYSEDSCPSNTRQLSKTKLKAYKTSQAISQKNLQKAPPFPEHKSTTQQKAKLVAKLSKVLSSLTAIKHKMTEFYMRAGTWPESFHAIDLNPKALKSSLINKTVLDKNGRIKVELNDSLGKRKKLWIYPQSVMGGTQIEWQCFTNFPESMLTVGNSDICVSRDI